VSARQGHVGGGCGGRVLLTRQGATMELDSWKRVATRRTRHPLSIESGSLISAVSSTTLFNLFIVLQRV
jgi:hypothetical protein